MFSSIKSKPLQSLAQTVKNLPTNAGDPGSIPGLGRFPGEGKWLTHSSVLVWRIPWTGEPGELQSMDKSLQSCPTLYDPTDGSPPGSPGPGILQARTNSRGQRGSLPQTRRGLTLMWMWFGAFPGAFGLGRAQPQRRGTSP